MFSTRAIMLFLFAIIMKLSYLVLFGDGWWQAVSLAEQVCQAGSQRHRRKRQTITA